MSGKELAERLGTEPVFMSGYTDDIVLRHGVDGLRLVQKPFDAQTLLGAVRSALDALALEHRAVRHLGRALDADAAAHPDVAPEAHVALDLEPSASTQRRRAVREALLEVAQQLVLARELHERRRARGRGASCTVQSSASS